MDVRDIREISRIAGEGEWLLEAAVQGPDLVPQIDASSFLC
jgi:hypothetical protein